MSIQINIGDHISPTAGYITVPAQYRWMFRWSRTKAKSIARNIPSANTYFATLPGGRTLTNLLGDNTIWINYNATFNYYGETNAVGGKEMAVGNKAIRIGKWTVLATIIHELAHVNGADGTTDAAERAILACRLGSAAEHRTGVDDPRTPYDPTITG